jgi:hypothetical protein
MNAEELKCMTWENDRDKWRCLLVYYGINEDEDEDVVDPPTICNPTLHATLSLEYRIEDLSDFVYRKKGMTNDEMSQAILDLIEENLKLNNGSWIDLIKSWKLEESVEVEEWFVSHEC